MLKIPRKSIYHNLGRNKDLPLDDDHFLRNHFLIYFGKKIYEGFKKEFKEEISYQMFLRSRRRRGNLDYPVFLLEEHFVTKNIKCETNEDGIGITDVYDYVNSLQSSVETWYKIFNPKLGVYFTEEESYWLDKLNRRGINPVASLNMVFFANEKSEKKRIKLLKSLERYLFITSVLSYRYHYAVLNSAYIELATDLSENLITSDKVLTTISENNNKLYNDSENKKAIIKTFKSYGFYK